MPSPPPAGWLPPVLPRVGAVLGRRGRDAHARDILGGSDLPETEFPDAESYLAAGWVEAGMRAPTAVSPLTPGWCDVIDCPSQAWVQLKTSFGPAAICFRHFQAVRDIAFRGGRQQQPINRRPGSPG